MRHEERRHVQMVLVLEVALASGCVPSRTQHYGALRQSRRNAYRRWEKQAERDAERPRIQGKLDLEQAVRLSLQYNTNLQAVLQQKEQARGRIIEAYSEALPTVDLSAGYNRLDQVFNVDLGVDSFQVGDRDNYSYQVEISQPLYKGTIAIALRSARLYSYLSDELVRGAVDSTVFQVATAYYDTALAERLIAVQQAALESAQAHLEDVESRLRHGVATQYDVLRARVDVSNLQADLIAQRNECDLARTRLFRAMGVSQQSGVELVTELSYQQIQITFADAVRIKATLSLLFAPCDHSRNWTGTQESPGGRRHLQCI